MPDLAWMAWTWQTGLFFAGIAFLLVLMTVLAVYRPETERVGILRIPTTRGDRLFIGLLTAAYINLAWLAISAEGSSSWPGFAASVVILLAIMWKG